MPVPFDEAHAATYDTQFAKLAPMRDALHLVTRLALAELGDEAHVLSVGAGTGAEILDLSKSFPSWRFTAVDTSRPMLDRCRARVEEAGLASSVRYHVGPIHELPSEAGPFSAATAILVSQFVVDADARRQFFQSIADRLPKGGLLVFADLVVAPPEEELRTLWHRAQRFAGAPAERTLESAEKAKPDAAKLVSIVAPQQLERIVEQGGFERPTRVFQTLMIHGWTARRR